MDLKTSESSSRDPNGEGADAPDSAPDSPADMAGAEAPAEPVPGEDTEAARRYKDRWLRAEADLQNFRRRAQRDVEEARRQAEDRCLLATLEQLDDLERALDAATEHEEAQLEEGVRLVHRSLAALLERHGIRPIDTDGKFDPHVHEALLSQPSEADEGSVIDVIQKGYRLGDRVVRPARVVVAAAPPATEPHEGDA
jgi:molecular chaperone GrpE